jgi:hypothetical protein
MKLLRGVSVNEEENINVYLFGLWILYCCFLLKIYKLDESV